METPSSAKGAALAAVELNRAAYSLAEFAKLFGKSPTWAHRLVYSGKVRVLTGLGHKLVPRAEVERLLAQSNALNA
jgi:hypothetical protein